MSELKQLRNLMTSRQAADFLYKTSLTKAQKSSVISAFIRGGLLKAEKCQKVWLIEKSSVEKLKSILNQLKEEEANE